VNGTPDPTATESVPIVQPRTLRGLADTSYMPTQEGAIFTTSVTQLANWARANSIWPALFGLACCAIEMMAFSAPRWDIARFGGEFFQASPRTADLLIVSGRLSNKMAPILREVYDQMSDPKWVISMGACASTGGVFNNYAIVQGVDQIVPVDIYVPGCPPTPDMLMYGFTMLQDKIKAGIPPASDTGFANRGV
jgi:NADH-quinone oxidoreductase subunit B